MCCFLLWLEWIGMTETWTRENSCAQLPLMPELLCSLLPPLGCAFSETCNPHTAVTVHIFELFPLLASLAVSLCSQTPPHTVPGHRSQHTSFKPHNWVVPLLHCCTIKVYFCTALSLPGCSIHNMAILGDL